MSDPLFTPLLSPAVEKVLAEKDAEIARLTFALKDIEVLTDPPHIINRIARETLARGEK